MLIDTHTHLYLQEFDGDREEMLQRAKDAGVGKFYLPNIDSSSIGPMLDMESAHPGTCLPMMGLHPGSVKENYQEELATVESWLSRRPFVAIGEIGIDLYWDKTFFEQQKDAFLKQVEWAKELNLPIVIHSRESIDIIIDLLKGLKDERLFGIFHCFTGTPAQAKEIMGLGFHMGIGGVLTFKNAGLDETVKEISLERLVLETDAPYLSPVPYRGKRNESAYLKIIAEKLAATKSVDFEAVAVATTANAEKIFEKKTGAYTTL
jgi:TatD DNase family protein